MKLHPPFEIMSRLTVGVKVGDGMLGLEPEGVRHDRIVYRWFVDIPAGEFSEADLSSGIRDTDSAECQQRMWGSFLTFLGAAADRYWNALRNPGVESGESELFPPAVAEWAHQHSDELSMLQLELEEEGSIFLEDNDSGELELVTASIVRGAVRFVLVAGPAASIAMVNNGVRAWEITSADDALCGLIRAATNADIFQIRILADRLADLGFEAQACDLRRLGGKLPKVPELEAARQLRRKNGWHSMVLAQKGHSSHGLMSRLPTFAWPGGYPIYYATRDGGVLCPKCANSHEVRHADPRRNGGDAQWDLTSQQANYEDAFLFCDHCNASIDPAYLDADELAAARTKGEAADEQG